EASPGKISREVSHVSLWNGAGNAINSHSSTPFAGTSWGGRSITISGWISQPPLGQSIGAGASLASPSKTPVSAHFASVSISLCLSDRSLRKCPYFGSANQGGIFLRITAALIALAHGRVSL